MVGSAAGFVILTALVATGISQPIDDAVRQMFRPDDVWGPAQIAFGDVVHILEPPVAMSLLLVAGLGAAAHTRRLWPAVVAAALGGTTVALVAGFKLLIARPDPQGHTDVLGAYPSGHTALLIVGLGGALLVSRLWKRWWAMCLAIVACSTMATALLVMAMHWFTDIVGGALLATATITAASHHPRRSLS
jgi:membrane-associated phospholipid phosphatase